MIKSKLIMLVLNVVILTSCTFVTPFAYDYNIDLKKVKILVNLKWRID